MNIVEATARTTHNVPGRVNAWQAFRAGLRRALRCWPLLLVFFAATLVVAALILLPVARALVDLAGRRLAAWDLAEGLPGWLIAESLGEITRPSAATERAISAGMLALLGLPVWILMLSVLPTLLSAGAIPVYSGGEGPAGRRFARGLWRYGPTFLLLLFLETALYELSLLLTVLLTALAVLITGSLWGTLLATPLLAAVVVFIPWWFEYARTLAVVEGQKRAFRALGHGFSFLRHNLGPAAALALLHFFLSLLPYLPYLLLTNVWPAGWWVGTVVLQQLLIAAILGARLARLAGQVALVQGRLPKSAT